MRSESDSVKRAAIVIAVVVLAGLSGRLIDFPKLSGGIKADEATYVAMAFSVADDFDLKYEQRDLVRFGRLYGVSGDGRAVGPEGIFLKTGRAPSTERLEYAKAFAYALVAAPFAKLGGLGGLFMLNTVLLAACAWCAAVFAAARVGSPWGWTIGVLFIAASSAPAWAVFLMPDVFSFALVFIAYFLWLYKEVRPGPSRDDFFSSDWSDVAAALLIAVAAYQKLSNAPLIAPLIVHALWKRRPKHAALVGACFVVALAGWFGANIVVTGEWNYQGGHRKTFYRTFPFDSAGTTFETAQHSNAMATGTTQNQQVKISSDILFPGDEHFWPTLGHNLGYFFYGRDSGLIPYYFPGALLLLMWLIKIRQTDAWQIFAFAAAAGIAFFLLFWTPYTWNGAGAPPGNRYFFTEYGVLFYLLPVSTGLWTAIGCGIGGMAFLWPLFGHPFQAAKQPWLHPATVPLRFLPVERTMMNDIPVRLYPGDKRWKVPFGDPRNASLYRMDGNAYDGEPFPEGFGFWIAGDASTEVIVATAWPRTHVRLLVNGPLANTFTANWGGNKCRLELKPNVAQQCDLETGDSVWAHSSYFYSLKMSASESFVPPKPDPRTNLGVKVIPTFSER
jgi:hypothetical protein